MDKLKIENREISWKAPNITIYGTITGPGDEGVFPAMIRTHIRMKKP